ncbi:aspartyl-tRNA(Asn)/glutamyl-tRNA(Gln) amidotransferase subunit A [Ensifer adhaerens]|uniref:Aspartyl-tRNA(Asn)/glutamyl-tRNA(Gln) amidotransferase subunit A n=1 Tax=Ensifer adhaerens TaxID=106592 RepID=A0ACC5SX08_ENSAD|nr:amidase [Ensifer adhaerens]MBP1873377.1 aspartyl-tRNA(Asn)/glutamyl-tRNA(Gln) amidotransferase subunit A [Ensifer adhaerens]
MSQSTTPVRDHLEQILARLDARRDNEKTYVKLYAESARAEADAADRRRQIGATLGPLDGRIVSIKDLFDIADEPTLAGSIIKRTAAVPQQDAVIVKRLRAAGAVIVGKTHMTEFAFTAVGLNPHYPVPGNATDESLIPGGSSSGAAVAAAEGTCDIAIGSDTGGSVRIPAALNGLVGFKPTASRVSLDGAFPLAPSLDSIGPLAYSVADCAAADAIMAGETATTLVARPVAGLRIGVPRGQLLAGLSTAIAAAFEASLDRLVAAGADLVECSIDDLIDRLRQATAIGSIAGLEASRVHADWLSDEAAPVDTRVSSTLRRRLLTPQAALDALLETRAGLARAMDERLSAYDLIVLPTTPIAAVSIASVETNETEYDRVEGLLLRNCQVANQFDLTAITLPMPGLTRPAGLMLVGRNGTDRTLLATAASVETLLQGN